MGPGRPSLPLATARHWESQQARVLSEGVVDFAQEAKNPILIAQGANNSRAPQNQSDSMVQVFQDSGVEVTYVLYPDEGHGLQRA